MPKRNAQERIDNYLKKIKRLEQKQRRKQTRIINDSSGDECDENESPNKDRTSPPYKEPGLNDLISEILDQPLEITMEGPPLANAMEEPSHNNVTDVTTTDQPEASTVTAEVNPDVPELDPEMLSALGDSTDETPDFGSKIHDNLSKLWLPLLKKGMPKDIKEKILKEYLIPDNCRLLQAPKLNAEISAAVPDMVRNRDKNQGGFQQQLGAGITAVNRAMDILLVNDDKIQAMKHLSNGCRILSDLHASFTQIRIKLIMPSLDKTFLHVIQDAERDETVFGNKLSEKIKAAKAIEKQGLQIKKAPVPKTLTPAQATGPRPSYSGNWSAPSRYTPSRGGRGGSRKTTAPNTRRPYTYTNQSTANRTTNQNQNKQRAPPQ